MFYYLSIGSNINPKKNSILIIKELCKKFGKLTIFPFVKTQPVGMISNNVFFNSIAIVNSSKSEGEIKKITNSIEVLLGRDRNHPQSSIRDREADIDIILSSEKLNLNLLENTQEEYLLYVLTPPKNMIISFKEYGLNIGDRPTTVDLNTSTGNIIIISNIDHSLINR